MFIEIEKNWHASFSPEELALVLRALGGRLRDNADKDAAKALGDEITRLRQKQAQMLVHEMDKHVENMNAAKTAEKK